ncbi:MAG: hypothetical protein ABJA10_00125 [Aestuariivirga sp.]
MNTQSALDDRVALEVASCLADGMKQVSFRELVNRIETFGYKLDRSMDCACTVKDMASGRTFPCLTLYPVEADTRLSFANVAARRDENFQSLQSLRMNVFSVHRNQITSA